MLMRWLMTRETEAIQQGKSPSLYQAVKQAIVESIDNCQNVYFDVRYGALMIDLVLPDGENEARPQRMPFRLLSDGYRNMVALVADITYRMARLNPHLGEEVAQKTPGIVLIDEIDLHLHPKWQRGVVASLKKVFPRVQFVATTHSPFIIQSLEPGELIHLGQDRPSDYADRSIEDIVEDIMGVEMPWRSKRYLQMKNTATEYYKLLDEGKDAETDEELKRIKARLDDLLLPYSNNPAYQAFMELQRDVAGLFEDDDETC